jgi:hypothetical protein
MAANGRAAWLRRVTRSSQRPEDHPKAPPRGRNVSQHELGVGAGSDDGPAVRSDLFATISGAHDDPPPF